MIQVPAGPGGVKISEVLNNWLEFTSGKINQSAAGDVLSKLIDAANVLHRLLQSLEDECRRRVSTKGQPTRQKVRRRIKVTRVQEMLHPSRKEDVLFSIRLALQALPIAHGLDCKVDLPGLLDRLFVLIKVAKDLRKATTGVAGSGARVGSRGYPGLSWLVFFLERSAHAAGGRFTLNKRDRKGSLLDALDLLRVHLLACTDLKSLANLIPLPSQHPIATYQRAINRARRHPTTNAQRWSSWVRVKIAPPKLGAS